MRMAVAQGRCSGLCLPLLYFPLPIHCLFSPPSPAPLSAFLLPFPPSLPPSSPALSLSSLPRRGLASLWNPGHPCFAVASGGRRYPWSSGSGDSSAALLLLPIAAPVSTPLWSTWGAGSSPEFSTGACGGGVGPREHTGSHPGASCHSWRSRLLVL